MKFFFKNSKGFTLMELVVAVGISSMMSYGIYSAVLTGHMQMESMDKKMTVESHVREGVYKMAQEMRLSSPNHIAVMSGGAGFDMIQFKIPNPVNPYNTDPSDNIPDYSVDWDAADSNPNNDPMMVYYTRGGTNNSQIIRTVCPIASCPSMGIWMPAMMPGTTNTQTVVANDVASLTFLSPNPNVVTVTVGVQQRVFTKGPKALTVDALGQEAPIQLTARVELRNP